MIDTKFMLSYDVVFLSETHSNGSLLKHVDGFHIVSDPSFSSNNYGGMAAYVSLKLFPYITNIRFTKCSLAFSFTTLPGFCFMSIYMFPRDSINSDTSDFGTLSEEISYWLNHGFIPYMGGDYNSRLMAHKTLKWRYASNVDVVINSHGRLLTDISELHRILPLNHCCYYDKHWDGKFTYHKAGKSSQIDFIFTNQHGRKYITDFEIIDKSWHLSDHLPLALHLRLTFQISTDMLFARAVELNNSFQPVIKIPSYRFKFNYERAKEMLQDRSPIIHEVFTGVSPDAMIRTLEENLISILNTNKKNVKTLLKLEMETTV